MAWTSFIVAMFLFALFFWIFLYGLDASIFDLDLIRQSYGIDFGTSRQIQCG